MKTIQQVLEENTNLLKAIKAVSSAVNETPLKNYWEVGVKKIRDNSWVYIYLTKCPHSLNSISIQYEGFGNYWACKEWEKVTFREFSEIVTNLNTRALQVEKRIEKIKLTIKKEKQIIAKYNKILALGAELEQFDLEVKGLIKNKNVLNGYKLSHI